MKTAVGPQLQILRYLNLTRTVTELEKLVLPEATEVFLMQYANIFDTHNSDSLSVGCNTYLSRTLLACQEKTKISYNTQLNFNSPLEPYLGFSRLLRENYLYCSSTGHREKLDSSICKLKNGNFIKIVKFVISKDYKFQKILCNLIQFQQNDMISQYSSLKQVLGISEELDIVETEDLVNVCVFMKIKNKTFVCDLPNPYSLYA